MKVPSRDLAMIIRDSLMGSTFMAIGAFSEVGLFVSAVDLYENMIKLSPNFPEKMVADGMGVLAYGAAAVYLTYLGIRQIQGTYRYPETNSP